jgi:Fuc2NAc and GlcNAc transferase
MVPAHTANLIVGLAAVGLVTWGLAEILRIYAQRVGLFDVPNQRSSHAIPTPRGGGMAIVASTLGAVMILNLSGWLPLKPTLALMLGGGLVAFIGGLDDRQGLPVYLRLSAHCVAAVLATALIGRIESLTIGQSSISLGYAAWPVTLVCIVWFLNLFNFMDGIDGIAISEAVFMSGAGGILAALNGAPVGMVMAMLVLAAACLGFVPLNWPPARMFMGDVGSGFLGFVIGILALATIVSGTLSVWTWILLSGTFLTDATVTLLRRLARGENIHQAHRSHAYQCLARKWQSHRRVTLCYIAINFVWLFPLAWLSTRWDQLGLTCTAVGILPLVVVALISGAGRSSGQSRSGTE